MSHHRHAPDRFDEPEAERSRFDQSILNRLSERVGAPDLTRPIMARLGYMHVSPAVARRRRIGRWTGRAGTLLAAVMALAVGAEIYRHSPMAR
ncbi:MAG: hypothetical protein L0219_03225, partial [Phycisphaerales bacterium]|nr:hypothetical protein [Phycisphaerales bacterium]